MTCDPSTHSRQLQSMFIGGHNNGNMDALHTHHAHKTVALSLSIGGYWARQHARRDDSLAHRNIWTRPGGRRKSTGIQTDAASSSEVSQDFRPLVQGAGTAQLVGGFVHAVTALPGVTDNPELERVCSRLAISAPHREWKVRVRDLGLDWCYRVVQEPRMTFPRTSISGWERHNATILSDARRCSYWRITMLSGRRS